MGVASGSGWNLWVWLLGVVLRRYIDFLILLIPTPLVSVLFCSSIPTFCSFCYYIYRVGRKNIYKYEEKLTTHTPTRFSCSTVAFYLVHSCMYI